MSQEIREKALDAAVRLGGPLKGVVEAAEAFAAFLGGAAAPKALPPRNWDRCEGNALRLPRRQSRTLQGLHTGCLQGFEAVATKPPPQRRMRSIRISKRWSATR